MPVTTHHPEYDDHLDDWQQCRDAADGSRAVKARGDRYLPKLSGADDAEYTAYKTRALWYGATSRTIQGLLGCIFRKPPTHKVPESVEPHLKDLTLTGIDLEGFCKGTVVEILKTGRYGILVDMGTDDQAVQRPYWVGYRAERIVNWATTQQRGDTVLTQVVLQEDVPVIDPDDAFAHKTQCQYRVLKLVKGRYLVEIWVRQEGDQDSWMLRETLTPTLRGQALPFIPFCFLGPDDLTTCVAKPPLLDLVDVNISHYQSSADLEHGAHYTALPTPWVAGFPENSQLRIGSSIAWVSNDVNAKAGMLEFTGQGLSGLETRCEKKEKLMAVLGARLLEEQKQAAEAADTQKIRASGEHSVLASLAGTVESGLKKVLAWHAQWTGASPDQVELELNKEFFEVRMDPAELAELVRAWQSGAIAHDTLYFNLERGNLTRPGVDFDQEQQLIEEQAPAHLPLDNSNPQEPFS